MQGLIVNSGGTALEFGDVTVDPTPIQKDIAILSLTDNINQNRGFHNLSNAITDTYENETQVTAKHPFHYSQRDLVLLLQRELNLHI